MSFIEILEITGKIVTTLAILIGGFWAYYKYIKGRLFHPRLELFIDGKIIRLESNAQLLLNYEIKNVGLSKVDIDKDASGIRVMKYYPQDDSLEIESVEWENIGSFPVLEKHSWVESKEIIKDSNLFSISETQDIVYKANIRIVGKGKSWDAGSIIFNNQ